MNTTTQANTAKRVTDGHRAGLVASIGCPRRLEICHAYGRKPLAGSMAYEECGAAEARREQATRDYTGPWRMPTP